MATAEWVAIWRGVQVVMRKVGYYHQFEMRGIPGIRVVLATYLSHSVSRHCGFKVPLCMIPRY